MLPNYARTFYYYLARTIVYILIITDTIMIFILFLTELRTFSIKIHDVSLWNNLPSELKEFCSVIQSLYNVNLDCCTALDWFF